MANACEVCGQPAVWQIADTKVVGTYTDEDGVECDRRAVESRHLFCEAHHREPIRYPRETEAEAFARIQTAALRTEKG